MMLARADDDGVVGQCVRRIRLDARRHVRALVTVEFHQRIRLRAVDGTSRQQPSIGWSDRSVPKFALAAEAQKRLADVLQVHQGHRVADALLDIADDVNLVRIQHRTGPFDRAASSGGAGGSPTASGGGRRRAHSARGLVRRRDGGAAAAEGEGDRTFRDSPEDKEPSLHREPRH